MGDINSRKPPTNVGVERKRGFKTCKTAHERQMSSSETPQGLYIGDGWAIRLLNSCEVRRLLAATHTKGQQMATRHLVTRAHSGVVRVKPTHFALLSCLWSLVDVLFFRGYNVKAAACVVRRMLLVALRRATW